MRTISLTLRAVIALGCVFAFAASADLSAPPPADTFVVDRAELLTPEEEAAIQAQCEVIHADYALPLVVLTIESMEAEGDSLASIETFARARFEQWGDDPAFAFRPNWRQGILMLVSRDDRKARIELGAAWNPEYATWCARIMDDVMVPEFKAGQYAGGIAAGVDALGGMVRGEPVPAPSPLNWILPMIAMVAGFSVLYGSLVYLMSRFTKPLVPPLAMPQAGYTGQTVSGLKRAAGTNTDFTTGLTTETLFDSSNTGFSSTSFDSGGGDYGGGGGATGSW